MSEKPMKIVIGIPIGKNHLIDMRTAAFCASVSRHPQVSWCWAVSHYPEMGRNVLIENHLKDNDMTHMMFVDSDTVPPDDALVKMLKIDKPFVSGVTPMFCGNELCWNIKRPDKPDTWWERDNPLPKEAFTTNHVGGSCLLIKREVFEKIGWPWFKTTFKPLGDDNIAKSVGEDVFLCDRAIESGYEVWVHPEVLCKHFNTIDLLTIQPI
jgi:GT2 family glycosyltransferase